MSHRLHPIVECAGDLRSALKDVVSVDPTFMTTGEKASALVALAAARSQLDELAARVLAASDDVADDHGLRDASAWLAVQTRTARREARRDLMLGRALERHPSLAVTMTAGELRTEQARVIAEAVDALPVDIDPETRDRAGDDTALARCPARRPRPEADRQADPRRGGTRRG